MNALVPLNYDVAAVVAKISAEAKAQGLSEGALCTKAGLARNRLAMARMRGDPLDDAMLSALCITLGKTVKWAINADLADLPAGATVEQLTVGKPVEIVPAKGAEIGQPDRYLSYHQIRRSDFNPRKDFGEIAGSDMTELADSIREHGVLQNLLVRPVTGEEDRAWLIVFGERRWRAIGILVNEGSWNPDAPNIPVKVRQMSDEDHIALALIENLQRVDPNPMEEAEAFAQLQRLNKKRWTTEEIARRINKTQRFVQQRLQLVANLDGKAKDALRAGEINVEQARLIAQAPQESRKSLLQTATENTPSSAVKEELLQGAYEAKHALFQIEGEGAVDAGPTIEDEETGEIFFTSKKLFMKAQLKAANAKAQALKKEEGLGFVQHVSQFYSNGYDKAEGEKGGVYFEIDWHGEVKFHVGYKARAERSYSHSYGGNSGPKTAEQKAREAEKAKRRTAYAALCNNVRVEIAKNPAIALRLALLTLLVDCEKENLPLHQSGVFRRDWGAKAVEVPAAKLAALCSKGKLKDSADRAAVWKALENVTDGQAQTWLAEAVASCIDRPGQYSKIPGTKKGFDDDSLLGCLAAALDVEVPEILLPKQKKAAE